MILKEGEKPLSLFVLQSGIASVFLAKQKKNIELYKANAGQILGEEALFGLPAGASIVAVNEVTVGEVSAAAAKAVVDASNPVLKEILRSVIDKQKSLVGDRMARRARPT